MIVKLKGENDTEHMLNQTLRNRGITNPTEYIKANKSNKNTWKDLDNIYEAVDLFCEHLNRDNEHFVILSDCDCDGAASATIMYKYIIALAEEQGKDIDVTIALHSKNKSHGLDAHDFALPEDTTLFIIPDAGTNDVDDCNAFVDCGIDIIILDHHNVGEDVDIGKSKAIIVNNQASGNYQNKDVCGAYVTLEFCRALDDYYWTDLANEFIDLAAVANVADSMSIATQESKAIVTEGCSNIKNKFLKAIAEAQSFGMKGVWSPNTISFNVANIINAMIRMAPIEERALLLEAFCEIEGKEFEYVKRGTKEPIMQNIYEYVIRLMKRYKSQQDRARDKGITMMLPGAQAQSNNKVVIVDCGEAIDTNITGLSAIRIAEAVHKPTMLVRATRNGEFGGSARMSDDIPIPNFRKLCEQNPHMSLAQGHDSAFGVSVIDIDKAIEWFNEQLKDVDYDTFYVDFIVDAEDMNAAWCREVEEHRSLFARGCDEPLFFIKNVHIPHDGIKVVGKNKNVLNMYDEDGICYVKFQFNEADPLYDIIDSWDEKDVHMNVIGTLGFWETDTDCVSQVMIKKVELIDG